MPAINIGENSKASFSNVRIVGFETGIKGEAGASIDGENMYFERVAHPFDVQGGAPSSLQGTRISNKEQNSDRSKGKSFSGWRPTNGPPLPAFCPNCKTVFPSRSYNFGSSHFYSRDNEETCPECKHTHAKLIDGLFNLAKEAVVVLAAPDLTHAMLASIVTTANSSIEEQISPDVTIAEIEAVIPTLGAVLRQAFDSLGTTGLHYLMAILALAGTVYAKLSYDLAVEDNALAVEQTEIAREALRLQKEQPNPQKVLEEISGQLADIKFVLQERGTTEHQSANEEDNGSISAQKKPKE